MEGHICWGGLQESRKWTGWIASCWRWVQAVPRHWGPWAGMCSSLQGSAEKSGVMKQSEPRESGQQLRDEQGPGLGDLRGQGRALICCSHRLGTWLGSSEQTSLWRDHSGLVILSGGKLKILLSVPVERWIRLDRGRWISSESSPDSSGQLLTIHWKTYWWVSRRENWVWIQGFDSKQMAKCVCMPVNFIFPNYCPIWQCLTIVFPWPNGS